jgi:hypothetical protein
VRPLSRATLPIATLCMILITLVRAEYGYPKGWVCNLIVQLLLGLTRSVTLGPKSRRTHDHTLLSHLRLPQPGGPGPRNNIPEEQGGPVIPPGTGFPLRRLLRLAGLRWRYLNSSPHGLKSSPVQSVCLGVEPNLGLTTYYFLLEGCCLKVAVFILCGALSDERTGLQFAMKSLNGPIRAELVTILHCFI